MSAAQAAEGAAHDVAPPTAGVGIPAGTVRTVGGSSRGGLERLDALSERRPLLLVEGTLGLLLLQGGEGRLELAVELGRPGALVLELLLELGDLGELLLELDDATPERPSLLVIGWHGRPGGRSGHRVLGL